MKTAEIKSFVEKWMNGYEPDTFVKNQYGNYVYSAGASSLNLKIFFEELLESYIESLSQQPLSGEGKTAEERPDITRRVLEAFRDNRTQEDIAEAITRYILNRERLLSLTPNKGLTAEEEQPQDNSHGDLVPLVWMIEELRRMEGGCTMNELIAKAKYNFTGLEFIKKAALQEQKEGQE